MTSDESDVFNYVKTSPEAFFSAREISRRAGGKRRFMESPDWAKPILPRMVEKGILESDTTGHYRVKQVEVKKDLLQRFRNRKWASPNMAKILKKSGRSFTVRSKTELVELDLQEAENSA